MAEYRPDLPEGVTLPPGASIDTASARYRELEALATSQKWSQDSFSGALGLEARRVSSEYERARAAAPAAPAPAPKPDFSKMTTQQQFHHALLNSPGRKPLR